jgi:MFS family permease
LDNIENKREMGVALKKPVYIFCMAILPLMICSGMVYSVITIFFYDLGASRTQIGFIFMVGATAGAILAPLIGMMSDKFGRIPVLIGSMFLFALVFFFYSIVKTHLQLYPVQALEGIAWSGFNAASTALIADFVPSKKRGWAMGMYNRAWNVGWIIGPAVGGFLSDNIGFQKTFFFCSLFVITGMIITLATVKEPEREKSGG